MNQRNTARTLGLAALLGLAGIAPAAATSGVKIGVLDCVVDGSIGLILGSSTNMKCTFKSSGGGASERYSGSITKIGVDIGWTSKSYITWAVFAPGKLQAGSLAGTYAGASAEATLGVGLGANVLIGGLKKSVALQPLSVQGQQGLNVALGVASMSLKFSGK